MLNLSLQDHMLLLVLDLIFLSLEVLVDHIIFVNLFILINVAFMTEKILLFEVKIDAERVIAFLAEIFIIWLLIIELDLVNSSSDDTSLIYVGEILN